MLNQQAIEGSVYIASYSEQWTYIESLTANDCWVLCYIKIFPGVFVLLIPLCLELTVIFSAQQWLNFTTTQTFNRKWKSIFHKSGLLRNTSLSTGNVHSSSWIWHTDLTNKAYSKVPISPWHVYYASWKMANQKHIELFLWRHKLYHMSSTNNGFINLFMISSLFMLIYNLCWYGTMSNHL